MTAAQFLKEFYNIKSLNFLMSSPSRFMQVCHVLEQFQYVLPGMSTPPYKMDSLNFLTKPMVDLSQTLEHKYANWIEVENLKNSTVTVPLEMIYIIKKNRSVFTLKTEPMPFFFLCHLSVSQPQKQIQFKMQPGNPMKLTTKRLAYGFLLNFSPGQTSSV